MRIRGYRYQFYCLVTVSLLASRITRGQDAPVIITQPQSQNAAVGSNVTFNVGLESPSLPQVGSGSLQLWLEAGTGVVTDGNGLVSTWMDQSGNGNDASQTNSGQQPVLEYPALLAGAPAIRFNGVQIAGQGDFLQGANDVGISDAFTSFLVYEMDSGTNSEEMPSLVGVPGHNTYGDCRGYWIPSGTMAFMTWGYDYPTGYAIPPQTYRVWTQRFSTNSDLAELWDDTATSSTGFDLNTSGEAPTGPGYYVGGLDPSLSDVGVPQSFGGDIAELIYYQGELTDSDRLSVLTYLEQKYYQVAPGEDFQWFFNGTNIAGATNSTITLTNVSFSDSGDYSVTISNANGSAQSSAANLFVGIPPTINSQPQNQFVLAGTNVTFSVAASGPRLTYQWFMNNVALAGQTSASLILTNVGQTNAGQYSVMVSNQIAALFSSVAVLGIVTQPKIANQPRSQSALAGNTVVLSVGIMGGAESSAPFPTVASGALQLWLRADAGVVTNNSGQVTEWEDQSSNLNNAFQPNVSLQPLLVNSALSGGAPAVRFNGIQTASQGDYLQGSNSVGVPDALTAFMLYEMNSSAPSEQISLLIGAPNQEGAMRSDYIPAGKMGFATWSDDYTPNYLIPLNSYRIWTDRLNSSLNLLQLFDDVSTNTTNFSISVSGLQAPAPGYYVGGIEPTLTTGRNFGGDIAEIIVYQGALTDPDRLAVLNYLQQKYFQSNGAGLSFQWLWNGADIAGATNAILVLPDVQTTNDGTYTVVVTNTAGSATSSGAVLAVTVAPFFTVQPQSQSNGVGGSVTFNASAGGDAPLSYQWQFNGINLAKATNTFLTLANVQTANAGTYRLVVTNLSGSVTSSNAVLTVLTSALQIVNTSAGGSTFAAVPIQLVSAGNENTLNFSIDFSSTVLSYEGATIGSNAAGAFLFANTAQASSGRVGLELELPSGATFQIGTQQVVVVNFAVAPLTNALVTPLAFGSQPTQEELLNSQFAVLPATYTLGNLSIAATAWEGDVSPRTNGDQNLSINDWFEEGRFVAGLDIVSNTSEFERADCAPRSTGGDGRLTVADWVQVGRYAVGSDTLAAISGPRTPSGTNSNIASTSRIISLAPLTQNQPTGSISVQMTAQGNENAAGFSVTFDPELVSFVSAIIGSGAAGAVMNVNTNQATNGIVGVALAFPPGSTFAPGIQELAQLGFASVLYSNTVALGFGDVPVARQVADTNASVLPVSFQNATLSLSGSIWPALTINRTGSNVVLSWPSAAATLGLQMIYSLGTNWSNVIMAPTKVGGNLVITSAISTNTEFFRLKH